MKRRWFWLCLLMCGLSVGMEENPDPTQRGSFQQKKLWGCLKRNKTSVKSRRTYNPLKMVLGGVLGFVGLQTVLSRHEASSIDPAESSISKFGQNFPEHTGQSAKFQEGWVSLELETPPEFTNAWETKSLYEEDDQPASKESSFWDTSKKLLQTDWLGDWSLLPAAHGKPVQHRYLEEENFLVHIQSVESGYDWDFATINDVGYLALANGNNDPIIYRQSGTSFSPFQTFSVPHTYIYGVEFFTLEGTTWLAFANGYSSDLSSHDIDSTLYRWEGDQFVLFQEIATQGARDWESFSIGENTYLAVANFQNDAGERTIPSRIYQWNGGQFELFQEKITYRALGWEFFTISGHNYLAVANYAWNEPDRYHDTDSFIYKWNGSEFEDHQTLRTGGGARRWKYFDWEDKYFLAVVNYCYSTTSSCNGPADSKIYRWNGVTENFDHFQSIVTYHGERWESFVYGGELYLAIMESQGKIYRFEGEEFVEYTSLSGGGGSAVKAFEMGGVQYLAYGRDIYQMYTPPPPEAQVEGSPPGGPSLQEQFDAIYDGQAWAGMRLFFTFEDTYSTGDPLDYEWTWLIKGRGENATRMPVSQVPWLHYRPERRTFTGVPRSGDDGVFMTLEMAMGQGDDLMYDSFSFQVKEIKTVLTDLVLGPERKAENLLVNDFDGASVFSRDESSIYVSNARGQMRHLHSETLNELAVYDRGKIVHDLALHGYEDILYSAQSDGLGVMNVRSNLEDVTSISTGHEITSLFLDEKSEYLYATDGELQIFDVQTNPLSPTLVETVSVGTARGSVGFGSKLYVTTDEGIKVMDRGYPPETSQTRSVEARPYAYGELCKDDTVLLTAGEKQLDFWDVNNPDVPRFVESVSFPEDIATLRVTLDKQYAFLGFHHGAMRVYNIRSGKPVYVSSLSIPASNILVRDDRSLTFGGHIHFQKIQNVNVDLEHLSVLPRALGHDVQDESTYRDIIISKDTQHTYAATRSGLAVHDIGSRSHPSFVRLVGERSLNRLVRSSDTVFAVGDEGLVIFRATNNNHPEEVGFLATNHGAHDVLLQPENQILLAAGGLVQVDGTDFGNLAENGGDMTAGDVRSLVTDGGTTLFMASYDQGIMVKDLGSTDLSRLLLTLPGARYLTYQDPRLYVSVENKGLVTLRWEGGALQVENLLAMNTPRRLQFFENSQYALLCRGGGIEYLNAQDPANLESLGELAGTDIHSVTLVSPHAFLADTGVQSVQLYDDIRLALTLLGDKSVGRKKFIVKIFPIDTVGLFVDTNSKILDVTRLGGDRYEEGRSLPHWVTVDRAGGQLIFEPLSRDDIKDPFYMGIPLSRRVSYSDMEGVSPGQTGEAVVDELISRGYMTNDFHVAANFDPDRDLVLSSGFDGTKIQAVLRSHYGRHKLALREVDFLAADQAPSLHKSLQEQFIKSGSLAKVGEPLSFAFDSDTFTDGDDEMLTYTLTNGSEISWLSFDGSARRFSGTPTQEFLDRQITLIVEASDGYKSLTDTLVLDLTRSAPSIHKPLQSQFDSAVLAGSVKTQSLQRFDWTFARDSFLDDDPLAYQAQVAQDGENLQTIATDTEFWLQFQGDERRFYGTPQPGDVGRYDVYVRADNRYKQQTEEFTFWIRNAAPTVQRPLRKQPKAQAKISESFEFTFASDTFFDADGDTLTYQARQESGNILPNWLLFDGDNRRFVGTPDSFDTIYIEVTATDPSGAHVSDTLTLNVGISASYVFWTSLEVSPPILAVLGIMKYGNVLYKYLCKSKYHYPTPDWASVGQAYTKSIALMRHDLEEGYKHLQFLKKEDKNFLNYGAESAIVGAKSAEMGNIVRLMRAKNERKVPKSLSTAYRKLKTRLKKSHGKGWYESLVDRQGRVDREALSCELEAEALDYVAGQVEADARGITARPLRNCIFPFHGLEISRGRSLHMNGEDILRIQARRVQDIKQCGSMLRFFRCHLSPLEASENQDLPAWLNWEIRGKELIFSGTPERMEQVMIQIIDRQDYMVREFMINVGEEIREPEVQQEESLRLSSHHALERDREEQSQQDEAQPSLSEEWPDIHHTKESVSIPTMRDQKSEHQDERQGSSDHQLGSVSLVTGGPRSPVQNQGDREDYDSQGEEAKEDNPEESVNYFDSVAVITQEGQSQRAIHALQSHRSQPQIQAQDNPEESMNYFDSVAVITDQERQSQRAIHASQSRRSQSQIQAQDNPEEFVNYFDSVAVITDQEGQSQRDSFRQESSYRNSSPHPSALSNDLSLNASLPPSSQRHSHSGSQPYISQ